MAKNKKSVLLYCDIIHTVEPLTNEEAGKLFKHYLRYINDQNPESPDRLTALLFEPIKQNLKRDLKKWEGKCESNSLNARARWEKQNNANACERMQSDAKHADKDTVTDKDINIGFETFWDLYGKKVGDKLKCKKKWDSLKNEERETAIKTIPDFIRQFSDKQYQPFPETSLNQKRWNDEIKQPTKPDHTKQAIYTYTDGLL